MGSNINHNIKQKKLLELLIELQRIASKNNLKYNLAYGTALGAIREKGFIPWDRDIDIIVNVDEYQNFCKVLELEMKEKFTLYSRDKDESYTRLFSRVGFEDTSHQEIHIDIFPMVGTPETRAGKMIFWRVAYLIHMINYIKEFDLKRPKRVSKKTIFVVKVGKVILYPIPKRIINRVYNKLKLKFSIEDSSYLYNISGTYKIKEYIPKEWTETSEFKKFEEMDLPVPKEWHKYLTQIYGEYMIPKKEN